MNDPHIFEKKVILLDDRPADKDSFGPHKRIAVAIRQLVTREDGGRAIALIGNYGSGKSTVINLLKNGNGELVSGTDDFAVFVFDAWVHEGDPLKRSFLEKLVLFLVDKKWAEGGKWRKKRLELSGRIIETVTKSVPQLSTFGVIWGVGLFASAIGLAMVSAGIVDKLWNFVGFVLISVPIAISLAGWMIARINKSDNILKYFVNRQTEKMNSATFESQEPTSVEFHSFFCELASDALKENKRLLLVIDNLDRVNPDDALKLWSAMRTFIDFSTYEIPAWVKNLWVLVAFDKEGVEKLWRNGNNSNTATFLDKTFQIRFRVPDPLLSDWRKYLIDLLATAFPGERAEDFDNVCRVYDILKREEKSPTPRDLKVFVNQIESVFRTLIEDIPLPDQAFYVALYKCEPGYNISSNLPELPQLASYISPEWKQSIVAIHYNMRKEEAVQVLIQESLEAAIARADRELIKEYVDKKGFELLVEKVLERDILKWRDKDAFMIGRAAYVLSPSKISKTEIGKKLYKRFITEIGIVKAWSKIDAASGNGIAIMLHQENDDILSRKVLIALDAFVDESADNLGYESNITSWVQGVNQIFNGLLSLGKKVLIDEAFSVKCHPRGYVVLMAGVKWYVKPELWSCFVKGSIPEHFMQHLSAIAIQGGLDQYYESAIEFMIGVGVDWPWNEFTAVTPMINSRNQEGIQSGTNMKILLRLRKTCLADEIANMVSSGMLFQLFSNEEHRSNAEYVAGAILLNLVINPDAFGTAQATSLNKNTEIIYDRYCKNVKENALMINIISDFAAKYECVDELLAKRNPFGNIAKFTDSIIQKLGNNAERHTLFTASVVQMHGRVLKEILDEDTFDKILKSAHSH